MERERDAWDSDTRARATTTCVYPRDDVNTPHESTRLLGRDGRAAQFGCSRSSLVTRRNSAQVVLLYSECGTRASIYDLSVPPYHPLLPSLLIRPHFSYFSPSCFPFAPLCTALFSPPFALAAFSFLSQPYLFFSRSANNPLTSFLPVAPTD